MYVCYVLLKIRTYIHTYTNPVVKITIKHASITITKKLTSIKKLQQQNAQFMPSAGHDTEEERVVAT